MKIGLKEYQKLVWRASRFPFASSVPPHLKEVVLRPLGEAGNNIPWNLSSRKTEKWSNPLAKFRQRSEEICVRQNGPVAAAVRLEMLKEVGCGSSTPPPGDGAVSNRQLGGGENNNTDGVLGCGGCGREIAERWYLRAADRAWHCGCLRCCHCRVPLAAELTCFARDGNIYIR